MSAAVVVIRLVIDGAPEDAVQVVEALLENGVPQDAINAHEHEDCGPLHVREATSGLAGVLPAPSTGAALTSNELDADHLEWLIGELSTRRLPAVGESALARLREQLAVCREAEFEDAPTRFAGIAEPRETVVG